MPLPVCWNSTSGPPGPVDSRLMNTPTCTLATLSAPAVPAARSCTDQGSLSISEDFQLLRQSCLLYDNSMWFKIGSMMRVAALEKTA